jgi:hypothetical protein
MMYSLDACYTPAQGEGPCTAEEALKIENETPRNVITMNFFIFKCFLGRFHMATYTFFLFINESRLGL